MHYFFGPFRFDPAEQLLHRNGDKKSLPAALNTLLLLFVVQPGEIVTRADIADAVWADQSSLDIENGINGVVRRLRGMLAEEPGAEGYIATVVGRGYRFTPEVRAGEYPEASTSEPTEAEVPVSVTQPATLWGRVRTLRGVVGVILLLTISLGLYSWRIQPTAQSTDQPVPATWVPLTFDELDDQLLAQAMAPSGDEIAVAHRGSMLLQRTDRQEGTTLPLPSNLRVSHIAWFAGHDRLLLSGITGTATDLWALDRRTRALSHLLGDAANGEVAPAGRRIAFLRLSGRELWTADADGGNATHLVTARDGETFTAVLWSADGSRLLTNCETLQAGGQSSVEEGAVAQLERQRSGTFESYDAHSGKRLQRQPGLLFSTAALLPGGRLVFPTEKDGRFLLQLLHLNPRNDHILRGEAAANVEQTMSAVAMHDLSASADGLHLSAIVERPAHDIYVADVHYDAGMLSLGTASRFTVHTGTSYPTSWSADGSELILDNDSSHSRIVAQDVQTGRMRVLADTGGRAVQGHVTPDGKWVLFLRYTGTPTHVQSIDRVPLAGGQVETLYAADGILDLFCSRSSVGRCLVREEDGNRAFVYSELDPLAGKGRELLRVPWEANALGDWSLSPDGNTIAQPDHHGRPIIQLMPITPSPAFPKPVQQTIDGFGTVVGVSWAPRSGLFVQTYDGSGYQILYVRPDGKTAPIHHSSAPVWLIPDREGKRVAMPGLTPLNRNVWMATLAGAIH